MEKYPLISQLAQIALTVPMSNAGPERGASCLKRIKTMLRMESAEENDKEDNKETKLTVFWLAAALNKVLDTSSVSTTAIQKIRGCPGVWKSLGILKKLQNKIREK